MGEVICVGVGVGVAVAKRVDAGVGAGVAVGDSVDATGVGISVAVAKRVDAGIGAGVAVGDSVVAILGDGVKAPAGMGLGSCVGPGVEVAGAEVGLEVGIRCVTVGTVSTVASTLPSTEAVMSGLVAGDVGVGSATVHAANTRMAPNTAKFHFELMAHSLLRIPR